MLYSIRIKYGCIFKNLNLHDTSFYLTVSMEASVSITMLCCSPARRGPVHLRTVDHTVTAATLAQGDTVSLTENDNNGSKVTM